MVSQRYEIRLDEEHRKKLDYLANKRRSAASDAIRELIDQAYEHEIVDYRLELVRQIAEANIEDVPDPEELSRQLAEAHDPGLP
jgi:predicted transcriptional regulator